MRKLIGVALLVCMASMLAMAGEAPKPEVYGGYQFTSTDGGWHGGAHAAAGGFGDSGMAMMFGGGLDLGKHKLVLRAVQLDWMVLRFNGFTDKNNVRVNTGILYRF